MITSEIKRVSLSLCSGYKYLYSSCAGGGGLRSRLGAGATLEEWGWRVQTRSRVSGVFLLRWPRSFGNSRD